MKKDTFHVSRVFLFIVVATIIVGLNGCSKKISFALSTVVPAAEGTVKWKKDKNKNYSINVSVIRLADPARLQPPKKVYVVWMDTKSNGIKNIGKLKSSSGLLSKTLKASLHAVTSFEPVSFFITAEEDAATTYAGDHIILVAKK